VARTAINHGGSVWCSSGNDHGAEFVLRLPRGSAGTVVG
jgi:signal transduction histidine kinase